VIVIGVREPWRRRRILLVVNRHLSMPPMHLAFFTSSSNDVYLIPSVWLRPTS